MENELNLVEEKDKIIKNEENGENEYRENDFIDQNNMVVHNFIEPEHEILNILKTVCEKNNIIKSGKKYRINKSLFYFEKKRSLDRNNIEFRCTCEGRMVYNNDGSMNSEHKNCKEKTANCSIEISVTKKWVNFTNSKIKDKLPRNEMYKLFTEKFIPYWKENGNDDEKVKAEFESCWGGHFGNGITPSEIDDKNIIIYTVHSSNELVGFCEYESNGDFGLIKILASNGGCGKSLVETVKNDNRHQNLIFLETASKKLKPYYESLSFKNVATYKHDPNNTKTVLKGMQEYFEVFTKNFKFDEGGCYNLMVYIRK